LTMYVMRVLFAAGWIVVVFANSGMITGGY
jgi:hypothetical protein